MRPLIGSLLVFVIGLFECRSQDRAQPNSTAIDLSSIAADEARRGVFVFYTQSFMDKENKKASYRGSVYGAIQTFELHGCELKIKAMIVDKFTGIVGGKATGELQDTYRYAASLVLTPEIAAGASLLEARPAQLGRNTHSVCEEYPSCSFRWLRLRAKQRVIHEITTVNDSIDFNGPVDHFVFPVSSSAIGNLLIEQMRSIADSRCH